ncbi:MAG: hypothetical protein QNJ03_09535 [Dinoroseobacter sp.]|nr:hypothetical protein [Dinoroseobacter sp.]
MAYAFVRNALLAVLLLAPVQAQADGGLLDGRVFAGVIGPVENPDLKDSLQFSDRYFWSDICTRCGFAPGLYSAQVTEEGIQFSGILESDSRGLFTYSGLVSDDGAIAVSIQWEKRRWYWTSRREIAFIGKLLEGTSPTNLEEIQAQLSASDPVKNPACARF